MNTYTSFKNHLIIAMPNLDDPNFRRTVAYICEHTADGAIGIIVNRPLPIKLGDIFEQMEIESHDLQTQQQPILAGGPVGLEQGFILHKSNHMSWKTTLKTADDIALTTSKDILQAMAIGQGPNPSLVSLGYSGWSAGQLEKEITENVWLSAPCNDQILFELPFDKRWQAAVASLGIDISQLSSQAGHS